jgi:hypothetical protein
MVQFTKKRVSLITTKKFYINDPLSQFYEPLWE